MKSYKNQRGLFERLFERCFDRCFDECQGGNDAGPLRSEAEQVRSRNQRYFEIRMKK